MTKDSGAPRLVKLILPADIVRQMDRAILASGGAYQDRNEYVAEAIRDRLAEEAALITQPPLVRASEPAAPPARKTAEPTTATVDESPRVAFVTLTEPELDRSVELGRWRVGEPTTVDSRPTDAVNFGLHNRDLPTLWALDRLAVLAVEHRGPVPWDAFVGWIRDEGLHVGGLLRQRDLFRPSGLRAGIGFPKPGPKREASIDRFVAAAVGSNRRADGPFFILALAASTDGNGHIAPTAPALRVLSDMIDGGLGVSLPQPPATFERWWAYLRELAPREHAAWLKVLRVVRDEPTREELTTHFPEWRGNTATTNTVGFISRSREWGLMEPELIEDRYRLTDLGATVAREG